MILTHKWAASVLQQYKPFIPVKWLKIKKLWESEETRNQKKEEIFLESDSTQSSESENKYPWLGISSSICISMRLQRPILLQFVTKILEPIPGVLPRSFSPIRSRFHHRCKLFIAYPSVLHKLPFINLQVSYYFYKTIYY